MSFLRALGSRGILNLSGLNTARNSLISPSPIGATDNVRVVTALPVLTAPT
jgi:hypothetical protein